MAKPTRICSAHATSHTHTYKATPKSQIGAILPTVHNLRLVYYIMHVTYIDPALLAPPCCAAPPTPRRPFPSLSPSTTSGTAHPLRAGIPPTGPHPECTAQGRKRGRGTERGRGRGERLPCLLSGQQLEPQVGGATVITGVNLGWLSCL